MKKSIAILPVILAVLSAVSCNREQRIVYDGPDYLMFSDTLHTLGILDADEYFDIPIVATRASGRDRTLAVEIIEAKSNAIDGWQYEIESPTVIIPAGELVANIRVRGIPEHIEYGDSLCFCLSLITEGESGEWSIYGNETRVVLQKCCGFDRNAFVGHMLVTSSYAMSYLQSYDRLITSEADPDDDNGIILKNFMYDGYDIRLHLKSDDRLNPVIEYEEQLLSNTGLAFGTIYGDGKLRMKSPSGYVSYYSSCENFIGVYMTVYVDQVGTVGTYVSVCKMISEWEADKLKNEGL